MKHSKNAQSDEFKFQSSNSPLSPSPITRTSSLSVSASASLTAQSMAFRTKRKRTSNSVFGEKKHDKIMDLLLIGCNKETLGKDESIVRCVHEAFEEQKDKNDSAKMKQNAHSCSPPVQSSKT